MFTQFTAMTRQNVAGACAGASADVPAGAKSIKYTVDMDHAEVVYVGTPPDPNRLRLCIEADFGVGFRPMTQSASGVWTTEWVSGPGQTAPTVAWAWEPLHPPQAVRCVLDNRNQANAGLFGIFQ